MPVPHLHSFCLPVRLVTLVAAASVYSALAACRTVAPAAASSVKADEAAVGPGEGSDAPSLNFYEATRIRGLAAEKSCGAFQAEQGIFVTKRDAAGNAVEGTIRVLSDNAGNSIYVVAEFNLWGAAKTADDKLHPVEGTPYFEGKIRGLKHLMQYRLELNGVQVLDPAASLYSSTGFFLRQGIASDQPFLNSVFWDFAHPGAYKAAVPSVDLRSKPVIIAEGEVFEMARKWQSSNAAGPPGMQNTYRFVATSGLIEELKRSGYNAVEFLPFNTSMDGDHWHFRYQVYGLFAPESRYGNPDDFAAMIDAFNKAGIAVIMDAVVGHYPFQGNEGVRDLSPIGLHTWKKADGQALYGEVKSPWGTNRYDYANPYVRRFLSDSILHMVCRYGLSGIRFDNLDGIRLYEGPGGGGPEFLKELMGSLREVRPEMTLIAEMFFGFNAVMQRMDEGGFGVNFRTHSDFFDFLKDNLLQTTDGIDMDRLRKAIRGPWDWKEAARVQYATNHDEAANKRDGATGAYLGTLLNGGGWYYVEKKTMVFAALTMLSSTAYLDMPQLRLLQEGSFNDNSAVDWPLKKQESQGRTWQYFADLSNFVRSHDAFAFMNLDGNVENHIDTDEGRRIISLRRVDQKTGKSVLAVVNLGHVAMSNYGIGIDAPGSFRVALDGDGKQYGGTGELEKRLPGGIVEAGGGGLHGKAHSLTLPYLGAYSAVVLSDE